ncbi:MAG TPA: phosphatase PAP2 family protein [Candidatus Nanoarchaeia archaeon]|nr:phosphatase PAP2 family protein [Candidatus Nanoarchaeia archaeon]
MRQKKELVFLTLAVASIFASFYFDSEIVKLISFVRTELLNEFFLGITFLSSEIIIFFFLTSLFLYNENKRRWIFPLWLTLLLSAAISFFLKITVQRQRPFQLGIVSVLPVLEKGSFLIWNFSFPSFQAMMAFCAIPILSKEFPKFKYVWIIFAVLVAFSRVYFGVHFLSDVISGALMGYIIGIVILKYEKENPIGESAYKKIFGKD